MSGNATIVLIALIAGATTAAVWWANAFADYARVRWGREPQKIVEVVEINRPEDGPTQRIGN